MISVSSPLASSNVADEIHLSWVIPSPILSGDSGNRRKLSAK